jgi:hypothetical protein
MTLKIYEIGSLTGEIEQELGTAFIPTGIFSRIIKLQETMDLEHPDKLDEQSAEEIFTLISELFNSRVDVKKIKAQTNLPEVVMLLKNIVNRVNEANQGGDDENPTTPALIQSPVNRTRKRH